jgi:two-component system cell cycle response regulator
MNVLIAEDSAGPRMVLEKAVVGLGHECVVAEDGEKAWELFGEGGVEVVISDFMMPGIDGDELCRRVRSADHPYVYFILLTSLEDQRHVMRGMEAGADDYLTKPLDHDLLEARLAAAARVSAVHRELAEQRTELERLNEQLYAQARRDPLTGVANRLCLHEDLETMEDRARRYGHTYAVVICDIDFFKAYNDESGHQAGDEVLRAVAEALSGTCRKGDELYRYGGEEFLLVLPEQDLEQALAAAERMRVAVQSLEIPSSSKALDGVVTVSAGAAVRDPDVGGPDAVVKAADGALYEAKEEGRNRARAA